MKKSVIVLLHAGYWMMYSLLLIMFSVLMSLPQMNKGGNIHFSEIIAITFSVVIIPAGICYYLFNTVLFLRFYNRRKIIQFIISGILVSIVAVHIGAIILGIAAALNGNYSGHHKLPLIFVPIFFIVYFNALANGIVGLVMKGFITAYGDIKLKEDLNQKNYEMELALIKSQISPHFLFNTLNNIDVLIEKDAAKASAYLKKLSDIMRFMLYETRTELIELGKELTYIEKYIELQKIRTSNLNYVNYSVKGNADGLLIAPMLFIPFIENAFKYAENKRIENAIKIEVNIEEEKIVFSCDNNYADNLQLDPTKSGLGNELIRKRLSLLYPGNHSLDITNENNIYKVKLILLK